jgi:hypothetical protein
LIHAVPGILGVKGSLKRHSNWWHKHETNSFILYVIDRGYKLPFAELPNPRVNKNNASARDNPEFVQKTILELLEKGVIMETVKCFTLFG